MTNYFDPNAESIKDNLKWPLSAFEKYNEDFKSNVLPLSNFDDFIPNIRDPHPNYENSAIRHQNWNYSDMFGWKFHHEQYHGGTDWCS